MGAAQSKEPIVSNNNQNVNTHSGTGNIINNNPTTNIFNAPAPQELELIQAKITAALQACHVPQAVYNALLRSGCMDGTRVQVLRDIESWIKNLEGQQIFWLAGMAGTGKSAIAWTVCSRASKDPEILFGGSFFCSRSTGSAAQRDPRCIVPTLAQLLARQSPEFSKALADELTRDPDVLHKQVDVQIEQLLYTPLLALKDSPVPVLFVIDALDECGGQTTSDDENQGIVSAALEALVAFSRFPIKLPVKFLVTSRPETHIRDTSVSDATFSKILRLHTIEKDQVTADIRLYIDRRLSSSPKLRLHNRQKTVDALVRVADGLFIVAATVLNYALGAGIDLAEVRFQRLLNSSQDGLDTKTAAPLDSMYAFIVEEAARTAEDEADQLPDMLQLLASLLSAQTTLSVKALADLLGHPQAHLRASLSCLHAVVNVPDDNEQEDLRILHASFGDYLFDRASTNIRITKSLGHDVLARGCLDVMARRLHFNISQSRTSHEEILTPRPNSITLSLEYACLQWIYHVSRLPDPSILDEDIGGIFRSRFLFWLEVLSVLNRIGRATAMLFQAALTVRLVELSQFLRDAHAFVAYSREAIERSALHIYISALPFETKDSLVYKDFAPRCTGLISVETFGIDRHGGPLVMTLTGHKNQIRSLAYSPDSRLLASSSADEAVHVWDTRTGEEYLPALCSGDGIVHCIAFDPRSKAIACGTDAGLVCFWDLVTGKMMPQRLLGHSAAVRSLAYASDGSILASASQDKSVRLWRPDTGQVIAVLKSHIYPVSTVTFSPDERTLASSDGKYIYLWHRTTGKRQLGLLYDDGGQFACLCFSPDGTKLAAGTSMNLCLWDIHTKTRIARLDGSASKGFTSVQFSPDGSLLVSAGKGGTISIWALQQGVIAAHSIYLGNHLGWVTDQEEYHHPAMLSPDGMHIASTFCSSVIRILDVGGIQAVVPPLQAHDTRLLCVSSDGATIVSGSTDCTVWVWDAQTGEPKFSPLLGHTCRVHSVSISPDRILIASASSDGIVRLWDTQTGEAVGEPLCHHTTCVRAVVFSPDGRWLASGSDGYPYSTSSDLTDKILCFWDIATGQLLKCGTLGTTDSVNAIAFSPDNRLVAVATSTYQRLGTRHNKLIYLWHMAAGGWIWDPLSVKSMGIDYDCTFLGFLSDCSCVVTALREHAAVCIWDIGTRQLVRRLELPNARIQSVAFSPDDSYFASESLPFGPMVQLHDKSARRVAVGLWSASSGALIATLHGHGLDVQSVAFTPNGQSIVSYSFDAIRTWDVAAAVALSFANSHDPIAALTSTALDHGWLLGPKGELLLWVPAEYRAYIQVFPCTVLVAKHRVVITGDDKGLHWGENWTSCWRGDVLDPLSGLL